MYHLAKGLYLLATSKEGTQSSNSLQLQLLIEAIPLPLLPANLLPPPAQSTP